MLLAFLFFLVEEHASAGLIEVNYLSEGDGLVGFVEELNLELLDVTQTNYSNLEMKAALASDEYFLAFKAIKHWLNDLFQIGR